MPRINKVPTCWNCKKVLPINKFHEQHSGYYCPFCNIKYADRPKVEAQLALLQDDYLVTKSQVSLGKMLLIFRDITYNLLCKKLKASSKFLTDEDIEDKINFVIEKMLIYYRRPEFSIRTSFVSYINQVILYPLYNYQEQEKDIREISLFEPVQDSSKISSSSKKEQILLDKLSEETCYEGLNEIENYLFQNIQKENVINQVSDFLSSTIFTAEKKISFSHALKLLILFKHFLNGKSSRFFNEWWIKEGFELRDHFEKSLTLLRKTLYHIRDM